MSNRKISWMKVAYTNTQPTILKKLNKILFFCISFFMHIDREDNLDYTKNVLKIIERHSVLMNGDLCNGRCKS